MSEGQNIRRVIVLGSTGSVGTQTLGVISHLNALHERGQWPARLEVVGLAAGRNGQLLREQAARFGVRAIAMAGGDENGREPFDGLMLSGPDAARELVQRVECEVVVAAIVGSAGLNATLEAVRAGRDVALANKEALVAAGSLVVPAAIRSGSRLLPVDSEHAGLWQCLACVSGDDGSVCVPPLQHPPSGVRRVTLTASGGPFRTWSKDQILAATPEQALRHPTWSMGAKVTIDSASLMNKALELVEAHWLFALPADRLDAVVHPQSIVHAIAEFVDGSVIAQLAMADMRGPIQNALTFPARAAGAIPRLDWATLRRLEFEPPDLERFPALDLARVIMTRGGTCGGVVNAANEEAVWAFLDARGTIPFGRIFELVSAALRDVGVSGVRDLADLRAAEREARRHVRLALGLEQATSTSLDAGSRA